MTSFQCVAAGLLVVAAGHVGEIPPPWGSHGHRIAAEAAVRGLPPSMPGFFRERADQLVYLDPEPDRWRGREHPEMDGAWAYDHYIDLERIPPRALAATDRWSYLEMLHAAGIQHPARDGGLLPFRIVELEERLTSAWRRWRRTRDPRERRWIEDRIVNDAGLLGHYVTDASQPHHTTIHFNGWDADAPNPEGFTYDRDFHARFEVAFVEATVRLEDLTASMSDRRPRSFRDLRAAVLDHVRRSHDRVTELYRLERDVGFDPSGRDARTKAFAVERLVSGAEMLQDLWWTAWIRSAE